MQRRSSITVLIVLAWAASVSAEVVSITADLRSIVRSSIDGAEDSFDEAIEIFDENGQALPISTRANLESRTGDDQVQAEALAISDFSDPSTSLFRNPQEIGAEANCFSLDGTSYDMETMVSERRVIEFSAVELNFPPDDMETVQSAIFPSGVIGVWSLNEGIDLTGLSADLIFTVDRIDLDEGGNEGGRTQLIAQRIALRGDGMDVILEQTEGISVISGGLEILPGDGGSDVDVDAIATARVAVIPAQQINYEYDVIVGERFILEATVAISARNLANGTGVTAVLGRPFDNAAEIIDLGVPSATARRLESRMNLALSTFEVDDGGLVSPDIRIPFCGVMGVETAGLAILLTGWRRRSRRDRNATPC